MDMNLRCLLGRNAYQKTMENSSIMSCSMYAHPVQILHLYILMFDYLRFSRNVLKLVVMCLVFFPDNKASTT